MQHIRILLLVILFASFSVGLKAINPPPPNDINFNAYDIGVLPIPGPCPTYPKGDTIHVSGTTDFATYNAFDFPPLHCFPSPSPDVWYRFRATGSFMYIEMNGFNDLDSFFVKLYYSQGSNLSLIPLTCNSTTNGLLQASFLTPHIGGEYYIQIGGSRYDETGSFAFWIKSYNECSDCVKNTSLSLSPSPWLGHYGTNDTVQMCVTVERWDQTTTSNLHSIIPVFGDEWDTTTLTPVVFPNAPGSWIWGQNVNSPIGAYDGFYFDSDGDGDPTNNAGEPGNVSTSWTACWSIATKAFCNTYDASVEVHLFSDNTTGSGNSTAACQEYTPIYMGIAGSCCPDPVVGVTSSGACAQSSNIIVHPLSANNNDTFNVFLFNSGYTVLATATNVTGTTTFPGIAPGDYIVQCDNVSNGCTSYHQVHVDGSITLDLEQTVTGCGPGSGSVVATPLSGSAPFTYTWQGITTYNDSLAYNLNEGYVTVSVVDAVGCSATDSIYVAVLQMPGADFSYSDVSYCQNHDTMQVYTQPFTLGGTYTLIAPTNGNITVDPMSGIIAMNNTTLPTPYYIYVEYQVGTSCTATFIDSVKIVQQPNTPLASSSQAVNWCIGSAPPTLSIQTAIGIPLWYDVQTTQGGVGYSYTPPLSASTPPGTYFYAFVYTVDLTFGCSSAPANFVVDAIAMPSFTISPDMTICAGDTAQLYVAGSGGYMYSWNPTPTIGSGNLPYTSTSPAGTTTYTCSISDNSCTSTGYVTVTVQSCTDTAMHVYSGITPNGDGQNDTWIIDGVEFRNNVVVSIYNRWGDEVWKRKDYNNTTVVWRGENNSGANLPAGTYYYVITQDNAETQTGWIELTR